MLLHPAIGTEFPEDSEAHSYVMFIKMRKMRETAHK
jgi:hypothetical protein